MKLRRMGALGVALVVLAALISFITPSANAVTTPPWEPDPNALGSVTFYDASGNVVTSGNNLSNMFAYAQGSTDTFNGDTLANQGFIKAYLLFAWASHSAPTGSWFTAGQSLATSFPRSTAPTNLKNSPNPLVDTTTSGGSNFATVESAGVNDPTTNYNNMIQVRVDATGQGGITTSPSYWETDIMVNIANNSWTQVFPAPAAGPTPTTTTLGVSPASPQNSGTSVSFTATVTPTAAGTVQFSDGGTAVGSPITVSAGKAVWTTSTLSVGTHSITAAFTPSDSSAFGASSTASPLSYTINSVATPTTTTLTGNPSSGITVGTQTTLTATLTPSGAVGSVQFKDGTTNLGSPVAVSGGQAVSAAQSFAVGTHSLSAVFTPTDSTAFGASTGSLSYLVNPMPATTTTTTLTPSPASPQVFGTSVTLNGSVSPSSAVGSIKFLDGSTVIATVAVASGAASTSTSALTAGSHSLTAQFVPTTPADFGGSTSAVTTYSITPAATTITALTANPTTSAVQGSNVTFSATVTPTAATGTVQFKYLPGDVNIGAPATVTSGSASVTTSTLPLTTTGIEAIFTPNTGNYTASPNVSITYAIMLPPPGNTTTALTVTPAQANTSTTETLRATITPSSAPGQVQFMDSLNGGASTMLGSPVTVSGGVAQTTENLPQGDHSLVAVFLPDVSANLNGSTSAAVAYTVLPPAASTTTTLAITPGTSEPYGSDVTFTATVTPSAAGTVTFTDGSTTLGSVATVAGSGSATAAFSTLGLHGGSHSVVATFVPSSPLLFAGSASAAGVVTITAVSTTTSLAVNTAGPVEQGHSVTLTATVATAIPTEAVGHVTFFDGTTSLGTGTVSGDVATLVTTKIAVGDAMLTATFNATNAGDFVTSSSSAVSLMVVAAPKITAVYVNGKLVGTDPKVAPGASVQVHASGFQPNETVKVYLHSTPTLVDTVTSSAQGAVSVNIVIPANTPLGAHTIQLVGSLGSVSFPITVVAASSGNSGGGGLANTGVNAEIGILTGLLLLVGGFALIGAARRRGVRG